MRTWQLGSGLSEQPRLLLMFDFLSSDDLRDRIQHVPGEEAVRSVLKCPARRIGNAVLIAQKPKILRRLLLRCAPRSGLPDIFGIWGVPTSRQILRIRERCLPAALIGSFVGDLSPVSLATWMIVSAEVWRFGSRISWGGIRESWIIEAIERRLSFITIQMSDQEVELWEYLKSCAPEAVTHAIGRRCVAICDSGSRLELDALANVGIFPPEIQREIALRSALCDRPTL